jgi:DNA-directed RNA polymerase subunit RPC12/RpoP
MSHECTTPDCGRLTTLYLCNQCVKDLQAWIDRIPDIMEELFVTMAKLDKTAPQRNAGGWQPSTGSAVPLRFGPMELRAALRIWQHQSAAELAKDQFAGGFQPMLEDLIRKAETLIDNPPEIRVIDTCDCGGRVIAKGPRPEPTDGNPDPTDQGTCEECGRRYVKSERNTRERILAATPANLRTRDALKWIRDKAGLRIQPTDVRNWAREGKLNATNPSRAKDEYPTYNVSDILNVHYRHVGAGKRATRY